MSDFQNPDPPMTDRLVKDARRAVRPILIVSAFINILILTSPFYMLQVYDRVLSSSQLATLILVSLFTLVGLIGFGLFDALRSRMLAQTGAMIARRYTPDVFRMSLGLAKTNSAQSTKLLRDLKQVQSFIGSSSVVPFFDGPFAPLFLALIFVLHWSIGVLTLLGGVILFAIAWASDHYARQRAQIARSSGLESMTIAEGFTAGADYLESAGMVDLAVKRHTKIENQSQMLLLSGQAITGPAASISKTIRLVFQSAALGLGAYLVIRPDIAFTPGGMIAGTILMARALSPVEQSINTWRGFRAAKESFDALKQLAEKQPSERTEILMPPPIGKVSVAGIAYTHRGAKDSLVHSASFEIAPSNALAIVGASGAGKTTLCRLLTGVEKPVRGSIRIDGAELINWNKSQLGSTVGYLPQSPVFFDGTIAENISRFGEPLSDADIIAASTSVGAHQLILQLPDGYSTVIGPRGARLSGGQAQMIGLARANFRKPKVLILDEPTAHLDIETRREFDAFLKASLSDGQTLIISTHDKAVVAACDLVLVMRQGAVSLRKNERARSIGVLGAV